MCFSVRINETESLNLFILLYIIIILYNTLCNGCPFPTVQYRSLEPIKLANGSQDAGFDGADHEQRQSEAVFRKIFWHADLETENAISHPRRSTKIPLLRITERTEETHNVDLLSVRYIG